MAYPLCSAGPNFVGQSIDVAWIAHLNDGLDLSRSRGVDGVGCSANDALSGIASAAEGIVGDLSALRVTDENDLSIGAPRGIVIDRLGDGRCPLARRAGIAGTATGSLSSTWEMLRRVWIWERRQWTHRLGTQWLQQSTLDMPEESGSRQHPPCRSQLELWSRVHQRCGCLGNWIDGFPE